MARWYPGHYLQATDAVNRSGIATTKADLIAANSNFVGIQVSIWWGQTEVTQGNYSALTTQLNAIRTWAQANNKKVWLRLFERSFHGETRPAPFPQYIRDTGEWYNRYQVIPLGYGGGEDIYAPLVWRPGFVRERFLLWCEKVAEYVALNPEFVLISNEEWSYAGAWLLQSEGKWTSTDNDSLWYDFAVRVLAKCGDAIVHCNSGWHSVGGQSVSYYKGKLDQLVASGLQVLGPTDLRKDNNQGSAFLSTDFGQFLTNLPTASPPGYRGDLAFCAQYEWPDYSSVESPTEHLRWAVDDLGLHFIAWDPDKTTGSGTSGDWTWSQALSAVNAAGGRINTAAPSIIGGGSVVPAWDGKKLPDALASAASAAGNAAAAGQKSAAYLQYLQGQIGSNYLRQLYRDGVKVWEATVSGTLPISGNRFELPTTATQSVLQSADIDTGEWVHYVRSNADAGKYIATAVSPSGGNDPLQLSGDLFPDVPLVLGYFTLTSPFAAEDAQFVVGINAGGAAFTTSQGRAYLADRHFTGGNAASFGFPIGNTIEDTLYQSERWGTFSYTIPLTNGPYVVTLHLAEIYDQITAANQRVFTVRFQPGTANEVTVAGIDIFAAVGANAAYDITREVTVSNGSLVVQTIAQIEQPKIGAITVASVSGGQYTGGAGAGPYTLADAYATAMTSVNDFPPGNAGGQLSFENSTWPQSSYFPNSPYGANVDPVRFGQNEPSVGTTDAGYIVTRRAAASRAGTAFGLWQWIMPPKGYLNTLGNWRVQVRDVQAAVKIDSLNNAWRTKFSGQVRTYGANGANPLAISGLLDNFNNTNGRQLFTSTNLVDGRVEASGGISFKNFSHTTADLQVELNSNDPLVALAADETPERVVAFAAVYWARIIPDTGSGPLPAGLRLGAMHGVDFFDGSGRVGTPGQSRLVELDANWRPVVVAYVLSGLPPSEIMTPAQTASWLTANPPPFTGASTDFIRIIRDDMELFHDGPTGVLEVLNGWGSGAEPPAWNPQPNGWTAYVMWGHLMRDATEAAGTLTSTDRNRPWRDGRARTGNNAENTRIRIRHQQILWLMPNGTWQVGEYRDSVLPVLYPFNWNEGSEINMPAPNFISNHPGGGSSMRALSLADDSTNPGNPNQYRDRQWHPYADRHLVPVGYVGWVTGYFVRRELDNPNGVDDRAQCNILAGCAHDWYLSMDVTNPTGGVNVTNAGWSRLKYVTNDWQLVAHTNLSEAQLRANPPPLTGLDLLP